jgi:hypothetical protein
MISYFPNSGLPMKGSSGCNKDPVSPYLDAGGLPREKVHAYILMFPHVYIANLKKKLNFPHVYIAILKIICNIYMRIVKVFLIMLINTMKYQHYFVIFLKLLITQ